jgi:predicted RNase H-like HicB family nuclease
MQYAIVIEQTDTNYSAYVPDLPVSVATGSNLEDIETHIREAIQFHLDGLREDGLPIPESKSRVNYIDIAA